MPVKIVRHSNWELVGKGVVLIACPPIPEQSGDLYAGRIVEEAALLSKAHAIIAKEAMNSLDSLARQTISSHFDEDLHQIIEDTGIQFVLMIIGTAEHGIEIRTTQSQTELGETADLLRKAFEPEYPIKISYASADEAVQGSSKFQTAMLLLGADVPTFRKDPTVSRIVDLVGFLNSKMGQSDAEE